ncbi:MAG: PAS domain S-box protein, partial [Gemmataceae bacterium]
MSTTDRERLRSATDTPLFRYGTTVAAVAAATAVRWLFDPLLGDRIPYATFFAAVALAAWVGGLRTGLLATGLGAWLAMTFVVPPRQPFALPSGPHLVGLLMYLTVGLTIAGFGEALRAGRRREAEQGERLRTTLASIGDAVITTDTAGRVTNLNPVAEALTGWANAEAGGRPLDEVFRIVNETTHRPVENPAVRALAEGVIVGLANHTVLIAKDGRERPIDDSAAPIRSRDGGVVGCVLVFRDISERYEAERQLRDKDAQLRLAIRAADMIVWRWDLATGFVTLLGDAPPGPPEQFEQV